MLKFVLGVMCAMATGPVFAVGSLSATIGEAHLATQLSIQVGLFRYCGMQAKLGLIPSQLDAFEVSHTSYGRTLKSDMNMAVALETQVIVARAGGKQRVCAEINRMEVPAVDGVKKSWANLQKVHSAVKSGGH